MKKNNVFLSFVMMGLLVLTGCSNKTTTHGSFFQDQLTINTDKVLYVLGAGEERLIPFLGPKTILFKTNPVEGVEQNGKNFTLCLKKNPQVEIIVAHSFGANSVVSAISKNLFFFKEKKILLLNPVIAGSREAAGSTEPFKQTIMGFISLFGISDYRSLTQDVDPLSSRVDEGVQNFISLFEEKLQVKCFVVKGDEHGPDNFSSKKFKKNYAKIVEKSTVLLAETNHPHTEILERYEVFSEVASELLDSSEEVTIASLR